MKILKIRELFIDAIRSFFKSQGFTEVDTPLLVTAPDPSPFNEVFEVHSITGQKFYLTPSPEFFMKKLLANNSGNIFQICKAFRDGQIGPLHNPEFTILEWYRINANYYDIMVDCENLIDYLIKKLSPFKILNLKFKIIHPWPRISIKEAFQKYAKIDLDEFLDLNYARQICQQHGYQVNKTDTWEQLYHQIFLNEIEPKLPSGTPLILYDYPAPLAALARLKKDNPNYAERFEFYLNGIEIGNGYSELNDSSEQRKRLINDLKIRKKLGMRLFPLDEEFVKAVGKMPPTGGIAVGVDRLMMTLIGKKKIDPTFPFN
ncbi:MAG: EF-P lysine aminoacylase EpmA [Microgenomates group bacterium]